MSLGLLQGIITARLLHRDLKGAYLALDTSFRIMPTAIPREILRVFCKERPLAEKYKVFMMACRSRNVPYSSILQDVLEDILTETYNTPYNQEQVEKRIDHIGAALKAILAYVAVGGKLDEGHVNGVLSLLKRLMRRLPPGDVDIDPDWKQFNDEVFHSADLMLDSLLAFIDKSALTAHHGLMSLAPQTGNYDFVLQTLEKLKSRGRTPNYKTYRLIVRLAGACHDVTALKSAWEMLVKDSEASKRTFDLQDRKALIDAVVSLGGSTAAVDFMQAEARRLKWDPVVLSEPKRYEASEPKSVPFSDMSIRLRETIRAALNVPEDYFTSLDGFYSHPMSTSIDNTSDLGSKDELRQIYDLVTADPSLPQSGFVKLSPGTGDPGNVTYDGIPLGELRFENWVTITELLALAERHSLLKDKIIEQAIEENVPVSEVSLYRLKEANGVTEEGTSIGLDPALGSNTNSPCFKSGEELREYVYHLRGLQ